jgi:hypothetical protein
MILLTLVAAIFAVYFYFRSKKAKTDDVYSQVTTQIDSVLCPPGGGGAPQPGAGSSQGQQGNGA